MKAENPPAIDTPGLPKEPRKKAPGHGRNGAAAYPGAKRIPVPLEGEASGEPCPECPKGKVYPVKDPVPLLRVKGVAPFMATIYELERRRCNLCGEVLTAEAPAGVGQEKYDESVAAMLGLLRYGAGLPMNRIEKLQTGFGIPKAPTNCASPGYGIGSPCGDPSISPSGWAAAYYPVSAPPQAKRPDLLL